MTRPQALTRRRRRFQAHLWHHLRHAAASHDFTGDHLPTEARQLLRSLGLTSEHAHGAPLPCPRTLHHDRTTGIALAVAYLHRCPPRRTLDP